MKSRYCYSPMTAKRIGRRVTLLDRIRKRMRKVEKPDVFMICGYNAPITPK
ncbi:MAG: hypothetical protein J6Z46_01510 [Lachnospiraceae bacterium]|nr:hypothetical protein [Lachnospiraceae bacterium]